MARLLTGKPVADALSADTRRRADALRRRGVQPKLVILRCGDDESDGAYIRGAAKRGALCGVTVEVRSLPGDVSAAALAAAIDGVNGDPAVHGCLLLRPLPAHLRRDEASLCARLSPDKDVDGMTPASAAAVFTGQGRGFAPCTAQACTELLRHYGIDPTGKHAVVIGRSAVVGRPVAMLLLGENATVTLCHTKTPGCLRELGRCRLLRRRRVRCGGACGGVHHPRPRRRGDGHLLRAAGAHRPRRGASARRAIAHLKKGYLPTMNLFLTLAYLFFIGSTLGWVAELLYRRFLSGANPERKWINPGFCVGPYVPLYGFGLCILFVLAAIGEKNGVDTVGEKLLLFAGMAVSMTAIEYIAGIVSLKFMKIRLWDYSKQWGNIQGLICPAFSALWAAVSAVYYFCIHPYILDALDWLSRNLAFSFVIGFFFGVFTIDLVYSAKLLSRIRRFADEHDVVIKVENLKAHIRQRQEERRERYNFLFAYRSRGELLEHLREAQETWEQRHRR